MYAEGKNERNIPGAGNNLIWTTYSVQHMAAGIDARSLRQVDIKMECQLYLPLTRSSYEIDESGENQ